MKNQCPHCNRLFLRAGGCKISCVGKSTINLAIALAVNEILINSLVEVMGSKNEV